MGLITSTTLAQSALNHDLQTVLKSKLHKSTVVGACVVDLDHGVTLFEQNPDASMTPASVMKLFTLATAIETLGPSFVFSTKLLSDGKNLLVVGDGDPAFGDPRLHQSQDEPITADFERWAAALRSKGMNLIPGDLIIDESIFDHAKIHPSWDERDLGKWYTAPVGALNFNDNCVDITVSPGSTPHGLALIEAVPQTDLLEIVNKCRTGPGKNPILHHPPNTMRYVISGWCDKRWSFPPVAFSDPGLLFASAMQAEFKNLGIYIKGGVRLVRVRAWDGSLPGSLMVVAERTTPLGDVLQRIGKNSQNLFAECLFKRTGFAFARLRGDERPVGSWTTGQSAVRAWMHAAHMASEEFIIADGSGLSRDNQCTARQLVELLTEMRHRPGGKLLLHSLATSGLDGSLKKQLLDYPGRVRAKTGTMNGIRGLAGYIMQDDQPRLAFALLFNHIKGPTAPYKKLQDRFCRTLVRSLDSTSPTR